MATNSVSDITDYMQQNALIWDAVGVGDYQMSAYLVNNRGFNLTAKFDISVGHGVPISLSLQQSALDSGWKLC